MKIQKANVTAQIIEFMKSNIENGIWRTGELIPSEHVLTEELSVSRASIRTAIQQFIALGLMESHHGKGTYLISNDMSVFRKTVRKDHYYSMEDIVQSLQYRIIVEKGTAQLAAEHIDPEGLKRLEAYLDEMKRNVGDSDGFVRSDMMFHQEISEASGNLLLKHGLCEVLTNTREYHHQLNELVGYKNGIYYHTMILEALKNRDGKKAGLLMEEHLQTSMKDALDSEKES